ncbi:hypothetical protein SPBRAN_832 [uncultured Candidatus Thioglobus sp.]|nr:hypothetical protein SPBRAN_832 [uncultured Candidatus Thioglobus sp.]
MTSARITQVAARNMQIASMTLEASHVNVALDLLEMEHFVMV